VNYESWHIALRAPEYCSDSAGKHKTPAASNDLNPVMLKHQVWLLGVMASVDHTSETQVMGWQDQVRTISQTFNNSPLAQQGSITFEPLDFAHKLKGMNGDHASDQKKTVQLMAEWKEKSIHTSLGFNHILLMDFPTLKSSSI